MSDRASESPHFGEKTGQEPHYGDGSEGATGAGATEAGATSESFGNLSVEDDPDGTTDPSELAGAGSADDTDGNTEQ